MKRHFIEISKYHPSKRNRIVLNRAWELIESVDYSVTLRWLFYRLLQEGYYKDKEGYDDLDRIVSMARKRHYKRWRQDTLIDKSRNATILGHGEENIDDCIKGIPDIADNLYFFISHFYHQEYYVEIWFEANAMMGQFEHYTERISLVPFGGHPSIPYKWKMAKRLEEKAQQFNKPVKILYFGDCDKAGRTIEEAAVKDIYEWCEVEFEVIRGGLSLDQIASWEAQGIVIPENYEKPGQYQWEAIPDQQASELIQNTLAKYIDIDIIKQVKEEENIAEEKWQFKVREKLEELIDEGNNDYLFDDMDDD